MASRRLLSSLLRSSTSRSVSKCSFSNPNPTISSSTRRTSAYGHAFNRTADWKAHTSTCYSFTQPPSPTRYCWILLPSCMCRCQSRSGRALFRMWQLVVRDKWIIFAAFTTLIVAALSELSIPHFLTASIFTAQSGNVQVFHQNVWLLITLCISAGICRGFRGCCFGIANMLLVKRIRETLYSALLFQDISFFDNETVGDLTSRLGSDCQQVSRVIGNNLNMILCNALQGTGALIYLLFLSWPLGLCTLVICYALAVVMLVYVLYQKKSAKLVQEFTASANEVAQETFSLMRTVRVYGTERDELQRYDHWLEKLAGISLRQSAAYGFWNLSFNTLYHSTQVPVLQQVSISVQPSEVVALVGLSGSGKSTLGNTWTSNAGRVR